MTRLPFALAVGIAISFSYADEAARETSEGDLTAMDINKLAVQEDDGTLWRLTDNSPITWQQIGGGEGGGSGLPTMTAASVIVGKPATSSKVRGTTTGWTASVAIAYGTFPQDMVDNSDGTSVGFTADAAGITFERDFGADVEVSGVRLSQDGGSDPSGRTQWKLRSSDDGVTWVDRYTSDDPAPGDTQLRRLAGDVMIEARYWQIYTAPETDTGSTWNVRRFDLWGPDGTNVGMPIVLEADGVDKNLRLVTDTYQGTMADWRS